MVGVEHVGGVDINSNTTVPIHSVHDDTTKYPTASICLQIGDWSTEAEAVADAPKLQVAILLGKKQINTAEQKLMAP